jgi:hypothetical protein
MTFDHWLALSNAERLKLQESWSPYEDGYWHKLAEEAAARLRAEIGNLPHVRDIHFGTYHGGTLILGITTDLPVPERLELPSYYLGFPVLQFCGGGRPK